MTDTQETIAKPLREDGRTTLEMRPLRLTTDFTRYAEGSVLIEVGQTRVLCNASVEERVPSFLKGKSVGWVTAEYAMLPRATETRTPRESARGGPSGRTHEIQRLIGRSLRSVVDMAALGERTVTVDCDVLQADGGTRTAAVTGGFVAIALALNRHMELGKLQRAPLRDFLAAVSVGIIDGRILLDLNYNEDSRAEVDMNVVRTGDGRLVEVQGTAETEPFDRAQMDEMLAAAEIGASRLVEAQRAALTAALGEQAFRALAAESAAKINWKESAS